MADIKNRFYNTLKDPQDKKKYEVLFKNLINNGRQFNGLITDKKNGQCSISFSDKVVTELNTTNFNKILIGFLDEQTGNIKKCKDKINDLKNENYTSKKLKNILKDIHKYKDADLVKIDKYVEHKYKNDDLISLALDEYNIYDLSCIYFDKGIEFTKIIKKYENLSFANAHFSYKTNFTNNTFNGYANFEGATFYQWTNFNRCIFEKDCSFESSIFKAEVEFQEVKFNMNARFAISRFEKFSSFEDSTFSKEVDFENAIAKDLFYFYNVSLGKLNLIGSHFDKANFLRLHNNHGNSKVLIKDNLANKDSARILKAHFENENNITEANIYFVLEQEFYLDLLKEEDSKYPNRHINKISLLFNKYVSNYGTDWVRVLIVMFGFGFLASLGYSLFGNPVDIANVQKYTINFDNNSKIILLFCFFYSFVLYLFHYCKQTYYFFLWLILYIAIFVFSNTLQDINNNIITLLNPLNIFNQDIAILENNTIQKNINYFEKVALYGLVVKAIAITLIYQFIISFRNSTRRK